MDTLARYLTPEQAAEALRCTAADLGTTEFAQVRNLAFIPARTELYPLAPRVRPPLPRVVAYVVDMDGTSTTTEPLALHALEYMVRRVTGRLTPADWAGLDEQLDYPHVIGNSNFRHTEFLLARYRADVRLEPFRQAFFEAVCWTLACMSDAQRRRDVTQNARLCGLSDLLSDPDFQRLVAGGTVDADCVGSLVRPFVARYGGAFRPQSSGEVAAALDIYYMRYHAILRELERGQGERLARELLGPGRGRLVEPMPGYEVFIPLIKGWLGAEADALYEPLRAELLNHPELGHTAAELDAWRPRLARLAERFQRAPARVGLVTASIGYETHACMREVVAVMRARVAGWPVPATVRGRLAAELADYRAVFDGFACASDVWEGRLKPHRDLYSVALYQMGVPGSDYGLCVGLEDTEPGIIALRAAGVGCAVALPNRDTRGQNYAAATEVVRGGLPELILARNLLLTEE